MKLALLLTLLVALVAVLGGCSSGQSNPSACASPVSAELTPTPIGTVVQSGTPVAEGTPPIRIVEVSASDRVLTDPSGKTLYILRDDVPSSGVSHCTGSCTKKWPPLLMDYGYTYKPAGLPGPLGQFLRSDTGFGQRQVLYRGKPLYRYSGDKSPGDTKGEGLENCRWSVAVP